MDGGQGVAYGCQQRGDAVSIFNKRPKTGPPPPAAPPAVPVAPTPPVPPIPPLPQELLWLLDAPMFIDEQQVEAFYDAVLRPDYEGTSLTLSDALTEGKAKVGELAIGSAIPWLKAEARGSLTGTSSHEVGQEATLGVISNPFRHLLALAIHYATEQPQRLVLRRDDGTAYVGKDVSDKWSDDGYIQELPRAMLFIDLPKETRLIPAALELTNGQVLPLFDKVASKFVTPGKDGAPAYPGSGTSLDERDKYWQWFTTYFNDRKALSVVEEAVYAGQKIAWIDYRVPLGVDRGPFMHLHIAARGQYDTGVFAYNFINRSIKHGVRLVGTLKSEPDLNVLAVFER
jgi:hypothetical protein